MASAHEMTTESILAGPGVKNAGIIALVIGIIALGVGGAMGLGGGELGQERFYFSYLVGFCFFMSLTLGALFFTFIQHLVSAGWSVVVRRLAEMVAANALPMAVLFIPIFLGREYLYVWLDEAHVAESALLQHKQPYLNAPFFAFRILAYFAIWGVLGSYFLRRSLDQDRTGDHRITVQLKRISAPTTVLFALTLTMFAFDVLMSLDPEWFSTIFGVYYFSGSVLAFFCLLAIMSFVTQRTGRLQSIIRPDHYQDIGKFMFAFTVFWTYIAYSQYMLIWYANIPEETQWFLKRQSGEWANVSWFLLFGHFILPFMMLISRFPKRRPKLLLVPALWLLFVHYADIYYLAMPELPHGDPGVVPYSIQDLVCFLGIGGVFFAFVLFRMRGRALVPRQDPRLAESLAFQNVGG